MDLRAHIAGEVVIKPLKRVLVGTGLHVELPPGYEAQVRPRSGLALRYGVTILNTPGTIDADYRGQIQILLYNSSDQDFTVRSGDRIAQLVVSPYTRVAWRPVQELGRTQRNQGGYGSTGLE